MDRFNFMNDQEKITKPTHTMRKSWEKSSIVGRSRYVPRSIEQLSSGISELRVNRFGKPKNELFSKKKQVFPARRVYANELPVNMSADDVRTYFEQHGEVTDVQIAENPTTEDLFCSAFVTFRKESDAMALLEISPKDLKIDGKKLTVCGAVPKKDQIFVGGLKPETKEEHLVAFFNKYGSVCEAVIKYDNRTGLSRCFGFVTFVDSFGATKELIRRRFIEMYGKRIEIKPAVPMSHQARIKRAQLIAACKLTGTAPISQKSMSMESPLLYGSSRYSYSGSFEYPSRFD